MKKSGKVWIGLLVVLILIILSMLGYLGFIPGLSSLMGVNKPKNLGILFSDSDLKSARAKSQISYGALPDTTPIEQSIQRSGKRAASISFTSEELTALLNNRPWKYWPIKDAQLKINQDGSAELSCLVIKEKLKGFAIANGIPPKAVDMGLKLIPEDPAVYVKASTALTDNHVSQFDIQSLTLGRIPLPVNKLLAIAIPKIFTTVYAEDTISSLSKYSGKKQIIINFINERINLIPGFYAKKAYFKEGKLFFDGTLSEREATVR